METIGSRLAYAITLERSNPNKIAKGTNIHASTIKNYLEDKGKPDNLKLDIVADFLNVGRNWLKTGKGDIKKSFTNKNQNKNTFRNPSIMDVLIEELFNSESFLEKLDARISQRKLSKEEQKYKEELEEMRRDLLKDCKKEKNA